MSIADSPVGTSEGVLLVEDNERLRRVLTVSLESLGLRVTTASDAVSALEALGHDDSLRFLISDVRMPGEMDGVELANHVAMVHPRVRVLLMTGYSSQEMSRYPTLFKPFTLEELRRSLDALRGS